MATPPFDLDINNPNDAGQEKNFPQNERAFRDNVNSYLNTEHDINSGHHEFPCIDTAARDAITNWVDGSVIFNTDMKLLQARFAPNWYTSGGLPNFVIISGSGTWTIESSSIAIYLIGAGGGGGGGTVDATSPGAGSGGGAGAYVIYYLDNLTIGNTLTFTIPSGGAMGAIGSNGGAGGDAVVASGTETITTATAGGGGAGLAGTGPQTGGLPGTPSGGVVGRTLLLNGSAGQSSRTVTSVIGLPGYGGVISSGYGGFGYGGTGGDANTSVATSGTAGIQGVAIIQWFTGIT